MGIFVKFCNICLKGLYGSSKHISGFIRRSSSLQGSLDRFNGVTVNVKEQISPSTSTEEFNVLLKESLNQWKSEGRSAVWLQIPITYSRYIEVAAKEGFLFHNAENDACLMKIWLRLGPDASPRFATHQLGVCGVVVKEDTSELLVIQEKKSQFTMWKFPGGLAELRENIGDAAVRETFEETGVKTEFASVIAFRQQHQHPSAFGRSDLYIVCRLRPLTFDILPCDQEVLKCQWMHIHELRDHIQTASITHRITSLVLYGLDHGFDSIEYSAEQMKSVYVGQYFTLFHKSIPKS